MKSLIAGLLVFVGCCSNVFFLELLIKEDPGSGNLITFAQFLVIAVEGFITTMRFGTKKTQVPFTEYLKMVLMFFVVSVTNNYALSFNIALPLHMIFRAGSLLANMVLGILILKKRYTAMKYLSVFMISVGICVCTIASAKELSHSDSENQITSFGDFVWWIVGISLLTFALFMSARMGIMQEVMYSKFGKHPREALFFTHALPLPGFLLLFTDISKHIGVANMSAPLDSTVLSVIPLLNVLPRMWIYLLGNVLTQSVCINAVFVLTTECSSLAVTLIVTLRKFVSLLFSIWYFQNPFTLLHWFGTVLVFGGTLVFGFGIPGLMRQSKSKPKSKVN
ncbi:hypothetical protein DAPPUDRAFT_303089 [Daphnia pulex]|uniref:UDP-xylose and UDP-N-acetylglucosamine transporter n=1 Tax=Daphnia pulex TaxID=6669 RepID=E9FSD0_DAPPU|nr:hypothetical protein DAPPUDRAFT_303089 [Daphnia pulex]|eukprot:EFX89856.1 hypothetical protein DAPPUDRAFT_303089 [Daphnia pulex]